MKFFYAIIFVVLMTSSLFMVNQYESSKNRKNLLEIIDKAAKKHDIDPVLLKALIETESNFNPKARGKAGEYGLMQIMPIVVKDWQKVNNNKDFDLNRLLNVEDNLTIGCWYLKKALDKWQKYKYQEHLALLQYNAGPSRAEKWKPEKYDMPVFDNIKIKSTKNYILKIEKNKRNFQ